MAGLSACTKLPTEKIVPYVNPPEEIIPGRPLFYATSFRRRGRHWFAGGKPHGAAHQNRRESGASGQPGQHGRLRAGIDLNLYDPDRSQAVIYEGRISNWGAFAAAMATCGRAFAPKGHGPAHSHKTVTSPTLAAQIRALSSSSPKRSGISMSRASGDYVHEGTRLAFGKPVNPVYHFDQADVVVSLDSDFLTSGAGTSATRAIFPRGAIWRGPCVEAEPASTWSKRCRPAPARWRTIACRCARRSGRFARQLAAAVGVPCRRARRATRRFQLTGSRRGEIYRASRLFACNCRRAAAAIVHALAHAMNAALGNVGKTVVYTESIEANPVNRRNRCAIW